MMKSIRYLLPLLFACAWIQALSNESVAAVEHVKTDDFPVFDPAFQWGFVYNLVTDTVDGKKYPTLCIQSVNQGEPFEDLSESRGFSVWTRDIYWGNLGWTQAGDATALERMKSTIDLLILAKSKNKADGTNQVWPNADGRYYIPQAIVPGATPAYDFYPYNAESQAHFVLIVHQYWKGSGDLGYVESIWPEVDYVCETLRLMDTNGNALPDQVWGSYDYQGVGPGTEETLMCATNAAAFKAYAEMAEALGEEAKALEGRKWAERIKSTMNQSVEDGGLWKPTPDGGGYYVNMRRINDGDSAIDDTFIPYENLVPIFFEMTTPEQNEAIFAILDERFEDFYLLKWGPMYSAPALKNEESVMDCSSVPWLGFLDVYLRGKTGAGDPLNRSRVFMLLLAHAYDVAHVPFAEGAGIYGNLTGGAGRSWDNGNFFHCLINGVYGVTKDAQGIHVTAPDKIKDLPLTELRNVTWRDATYDFSWKGTGSQIKRLSVDGKQIEVRTPDAVSYLLDEPEGRHEVVIELASPAMP